MYIPQDIIDNILREDELKLIPYFDLIKLCAECDLIREKALKILKLYDKTSCCNIERHIDLCNKYNIFYTKPIDSNIIKYCNYITHHHKPQQCINFSQISKTRYSKAVMCD